LAEALEAFESALEVFKATRMGWHVGITEKNIDEAMEELSAINGGK
jgi:hypothetical protein